MATTAIDFTKINSKKYRLWRVLQSNPVMALVYRNRLAKLDSFKSAIVFPEQMLGLNQSRIWAVSFHVATNEVSVKIRAIYDFTLTAGQEDIKTMDQILDVEKDLVDKRDIKVGRQEGTFVQLNLFSNLGDATKFGEKEQRKLLSKYC